ncbi:MAG: DUF3187 family protein [Armatimonadota bacterium]
MKRVWFILVWAVLVAGRGQCETNEWRSPLFVRNAEPLNMLFLQASPVSASQLSHRQVRVNLAVDVVNHLLFDRQGESLFEQDLKVKRVTLGYAVGVGDGWEFAASLPVLARNGGFLDELINLWHRWFDLKGGGRANHRNYQIHMQVVHNGQAVVSLSKPAIGLGDVTVEVRKLLGQSTEVCGQLVPC